jgi:hypothetical protein
MTNGVTYTTKDLSGWSEKRRGEIELDVLARAYLGNPEITDRDRIAFALRELRKRGSDVEACPVDWTKPLMICSVEDSKWDAFGEPPPSKLYKRLDRMRQRSPLMTEREFNRLLRELYPAEGLFEHSDFLKYQYEFTFKGDPALVEAVFREVGFATQHGLLVPDDGSEAHHCLGVAPPTIVSP